MNGRHKAGEKAGTAKNSRRVGRASSKMPEQMQYAVEQGPEATYSRH